MELNVSGFSIPITMLYAGIVTILVVLLQINVIRQRVSGSVSLGDGGNKALERATRAHGNAIENVPLTLIMMAIIEGAGAPDMAVQVFGISLVAARLLHAIGIQREPDENILRLVGAALNMLVLLSTAAYALYFVFK